MEERHFLRSRQLVGVGFLAFATLLGPASVLAHAQGLASSGRGGNLAGGSGQGALAASAADHSLVDKARELAAKHPCLVDLGKTVLSARSAATYCSVVEVNPLAIPPCAIQLANTANNATNAINSCLVAPARNYLKARPNHRNSTPLATSSSGNLSLGVNTNLGFGSPGRSTKGGRSGHGGGRSSGSGRGGSGGSPGRRY